MGWRGSGAPHSKVSSPLTTDSSLSYEQAASGSLSLDASRANVTVCAVAFRRMMHRSKMAARVQPQQQATPLRENSSKGSSPNLEENHVVVAVVEVAAVVEGAVPFPVMLATITVGAITTVANMKACGPWVWALVWAAVFVLVSLVMTTLGRCSVMGCAMVVVAVDLVVVVAFMAVVMVVVVIVVVVVVVSGSSSRPTMALWNSPW